MPRDAHMKMAESLTELTILCFLASILTATAGRICEADWTYHNLTGTCMRIFVGEFSSHWLGANHICTEYVGGINKTTIGHLVYIYNQETDSFVKGLLDIYRVNSSLIGLQDRMKDGEYEWGLTDELATYTGWRDKPHFSVRSKDSVLITKDGWEEFDYTGNVGFICQVDAVFQQPEMTCLAAEEGRESPAMNCTVRVLSPATFKELRFDRGGASLSSCSSGGCEHGAFYETDIKMSKQMNEDVVSSSLKIKRVERSQNNIFTCTVTLDNVPKPVTQSCELTIYYVPEEPSCSHRFFQSQIRVACTTEKVYPQAVCKWELYRDSIHKDPGKGVFLHEPLPGTVYYRTTCILRYIPESAGLYRFQISMYPNITGLGNPQTGAVVSTNMSVRVGPPEFCSSENSNPSYPVYVNTNVTISMCVLAYPFPEKFALYQANIIMATERYRVNFRFMNEKMEQGEIILTISSFRKEDLGPYKLYSEYKRTSIFLHSYLYFELTSQDSLYDGGQYFFSSDVSIIIIIILGLVVLVLTAIILFVRRRGRTSTDDKNTEMMTLASRRGYLVPCDDHEDSTCYITPTSPDYATDSEMSFMRRSDADYAACKDGVMVGKTCQNEDYLEMIAEDETDNEIIPALPRKPRTNTAVVVETRYVEATSEPVTEVNKKISDYDVLSEDEVAVHPKDQDDEEEEDMYQTID